MADEKPIGNPRGRPRSPGSKLGGPAVCHPEKEARTRSGLCLSCWQRTYRNRASTLNKSFNYEELAELTGLTVKQMKLVVRAMSKAMFEGLKRDRKVMVLRFGTFRVYPNYKDRGKTVRRRKIWFRPHQALDYMLNPHLYKELDDRQADNS